MSQKIRIKLKSYDHNLVDKSAEKIVRTVKATGAIVSIFFPNNPGISLIFNYQTLISTSTPLGNSNFIRASTVLAVEL